MYQPEKDQTEIFVENINRLLYEKDMSQNKLARLVGVSVTMTNKWCRGIAMPRNENLDKLCQVLNCRRSDLLADKSAAPNLSIPAARAVPFLGLICAGDGMITEESFDGYFFVDNSIRADYCLRVEGDSMKDAGINHGDIAFIRKSWNFLNGGLYAVWYGEDKVATLKKVYKQGDGLLLMPCNQKYGPIYVEDAVIVGECIGVYHPM